MNKLQLLIIKSLENGKSFRDIERDTGISHASISKYHKGAIPEGKQLAILAKYYHTDFWELVEVKRQCPPKEHISEEMILLEKEVADLSRDELLQAVLEVRKLKRHREQQLS